MADLLVAAGNCSSVELLQIEAYKATLLEGDGGRNGCPRDAYDSKGGGGGEFILIFCLYGQFD